VETVAFVRQLVDSKQMHALTQYSIKMNTRTNRIAQQRSKIRFDFVRRSRCSSWHRGKLVQVVEDDMQDNKLTLNCPIYIPFHTSRQHNTAKRYY